MRITHIYHSGFAVELTGCSLVFDWYTGELPELPADKPLVVFVSHAHPDHFGHCIWELPRRFDDVIYLLDADVARQAPRDTGKRVVPLAAYQDADAAGLHVRTVDSNDEGVAFLVEAPEARIFFSGDLNAWWWDREQEANEASEEFFRKRLRSLAAGGPVDVGFVPVDPRLVDPTLGLVAFEQELGAKLTVPMHYWDDRIKVERIVADDPRLDGWRDSIRFDDVIDFDPSGDGRPAHDSGMRA